MVDHAAMQELLLTSADEAGASVRRKTVVEHPAPGDPPTGLRACRVGPVSHRGAILSGALSPTLSNANVRLPADGVQIARPDKRGRR